ncbi:B-box zinc finger family protein [Striga asiatica]|uniref:B-box zinc finger family protein n=1 Tax=Striga asiatica TaxID=4170 RepID=A0A5A7QB62_STRAF|nr:B-box zinc finger family protein [Striga asiatica]
MKIQCDVCEKDEAVLFCVADEAALCAACDHRVHHANKLAGKHHRFSLHRPEASLCDICQDKTAFLFCQQDRALLCSECDIPIHKANELTQKHTRFLLTGIKLSPNPIPYSNQPPSSESTNSTNNKSSLVVPDVKNPENVKQVCSIAQACTPPKAKCTTAQSTPALAPEKFSNDNPLMGFDCSASSISEYVETLPGWHVEDLLHSYCPSPYGFPKNGGDEMLQQFWDEAEIQGNMSTFSTGKMGFVVPPFQQQTHNPSYQCMDQIDFGLPYGLTEQAKGFVTNYDNGNNNNNNNSNNSYIMIKPTRKRSEDNCFAVPQFNPHLSVSERSTSFY